MGAECCRPERSTVLRGHEGVVVVSESSTVDQGVRVEHAAAQIGPGQQGSPRTPRIDRRSPPAKLEQESGQSWSAEAALGVWRHSEGGGDITILRMGRMVEITNPQKSKQLLHPNNFVRGDEFHYFGCRGILKGNRIHWSDSSTWTKKDLGVSKPPAEAPVAEQPTLQCLRPRAPTTPDSWITTGAPLLQQTSGKWYYEVRIGEGVDRPQVGWLAAGFVEGDASAQGVGDDEHGFAVDGLLGQRCLGGTREDVAWPQPWKKGGIVGCAIDLDGGQMQFAYSGEWFAVSEIKFDPAGRAFYPAISATGMFKIFFTASAFRFAPPDDSFAPLIGPEQDGEFTRPVAFE